jgi:hypothetical protein
MAWLGVSAWLAGLALALSEEPVAGPAESPRAALERLNVLAGDWRGIGQPRRQSNHDAWAEKSNYLWDLSGPTPALVQTADGGRLMPAARCEFDPVSREYVLTIVAADASSRVYRGTWVGDQLVLTSPGTPETPSRRITFSLRSQIRVVVLHEAAEPGRTTYYRVAEVGYTRAGERLALPDGGQPQCVVTGGLGEIVVQHNGQTYYVCCTGCRQAFEADPEGILREYRERLARERQKPSRD